MNCVPPLCLRGWKGQSASFTGPRRSSRAIISTRICRSNSTATSGLRRRPPSNPCRPNPRKDFPKPIHSDCEPIAEAQPPKIGQHGRGRPTLRHCRLRRRLPRTRLDPICGRHPHLASFDLDQHVVKLFRTTSPYISHYLCMIWQICEERCLLFADAVRRGIWRCESA